MTYVRKTDRKTHDELYGLKDPTLYRKLYARKHSHLKTKGDDSYYNMSRRETERMAAPEPTITVDEDAFGRVVHELERQLKEFPDNELLIINLKKQLKLWKY